MVPAGHAKPQGSPEGAHVEFQNVTFAYPSRPDIKVHCTAMHYTALLLHELQDPCLCVQQLSMLECSTTHCNTPWLHAMLDGHEDRGAHALPPHCMTRECVLALQATPNMHKHTCSLQS